MSAGKPPATRNPTTMSSSKTTIRDGEWIANGVTSQGCRWVKRATTVAEFETLGYLHTDMTRVLERLNPEDLIAVTEVFTPFGTFLDSVQPLDEAGDVMADKPSIAPANDSEAAEDES